jgi:hypothetical protein
MAAAAAVAVGVKLRQRQWAVGSESVAVATRCLQFRSTFVKLCIDPSRYMIDLKNNPNSPSAQHKTSSHYRNAILPQPSIERMNHFIDTLRSYKVLQVDRSEYGAIRVYQL